MSGPHGYPNNPHADRAGALLMNVQRAEHAVRVTYFHWGIHAWSVYVIVGLCLAWFGFRKKLPLTLRSALYPVLGERIHGTIGHVVDLLAVFGTVFGVATSLGLGVKQMGAGLNALNRDRSRHRNANHPDRRDLDRGHLVGGVGDWPGYPHHFGVEHLPHDRAVGFFLFFGPFEWLMGFFATTAGNYLWTAIPMGFWTAGQEDTAIWQSNWTIFYWGWWISWAPFVGMFIARISRGRTLREFVAGAMFVPTALGALWIALLGGNAIHLELNANGGAGTAGIMELVRAQNLEAALYRTIASMSDLSWLTWSMSALATFLLATWFITSSDSGTLVITTMLSMGDDHPPQRFRVVLGAGPGVGGRGAVAGRRAARPANRIDRRRATRQCCIAVYDVRPAPIPYARHIGGARRLGRILHQGPR